MTPQGLAIELGVSASAIRSWLRAMKIRPSTDKSRRWDLTASQADLVRAAFGPPAKPSRRDQGLVPAGLTRRDVLDQLWREHEQRHDAFWSQYWRWGAFLIGVQVTPYINALAREAMGIAVIIFPVAAVVGAVFLAVLLGGEYLRLRAVDRRLSLARGVLPPIPDKRFLRVFKLPLGWLAIGYLVAGILIVSVANFFVLLQAISIDAVASQAP